MILASNSINWAEMDNLWAVVALGVVNVSSIAINLIGQRRSKNRGAAREKKLTDVVNKVGAIKDVADNVDVIKQEVKNDHPDDANLRDQLDRMEANQNRMQKSQEQMQERQELMATDVRGVKSDLSGVKRDVGRLADTAVDDRETHRTDIARLDRDIDDLKRGH